MHAIVTADWHIKSTQLKEFTDAVDDFLDCQETVGAEELIILGDLTHDIGPLPHVVIEALVTQLARLRRAFPKITVLMGNHDYGSHTADSANTSALLRQLGCTVHYKPAILDGCLWLPYQHNIQDAEDILRQHAGDMSIRTVFFHQGVTSAKFNMLKEASGVLPISAFDGYALAVGGDYHHQQNLPKTNIWYCGSPYFNNWGEANQDKGFLQIRDTSVTGAWLSRCQQWINTAWPNAPRIIPPGSRVKAEVLASASAGTIDRVKAKFKGSDVTIVVKPEVQHLRADAATEDDAFNAYWATVEGVTAEEAAEVPKAILEALWAFPGAGNPVLRVSRVKAENILSYGKLDFTFEPGLTVLSASNGSGKTALMQMIPIALFGETTSGQKATALRRYESTGPAYVEMEATSGKALTIRRNRYPNTHSSVVYDGKQVQEGSNPAALITKLTGFTSDTLAASLFVDQRAVNGLLSGKPAEQRGLLSALCGLEAYRQAQAVWTTKLQAATKAQLASSNVLVEARYEVQRVEDRRAFVSAANAKLKASRVADLDKKAAENETLRAQLAEAEKVQIAAVSKWQVAVRAQLALEELRDSVYSKLGSVPVEPEKPSSVCIACSQKISASKLQQMMKVYAKDVATHQELVVAYAALQTEHAALVESCRKSRKGLDKLAEDKSTAVAEANALRGLLNRSTAEVKEATALASKKPEPLPDLTEAKKAALAASEAVQTANHAVRICTLVRDALSPKGIPSYLVQNLVPRLNQAVCRLYTILDPPVSVDFYAEDESLKVRIAAIHGGRALNEVSNGQKQLASVMVTLALRSLVDSNVLFLDELEIGLDAENCQKLAELVNSLKEYYPCIIVASHNPRLLEYLEVDRMFKITQTQEGSVLHDVAGRV
jgi:DNA repair exonuclease SbcCD ATPase subunit/DNA repair exonuclease SbcCD nuclease subunit